MDADRTGGSAGRAPAPRAGWVRRRSVAAAAGLVVVGALGLSGCAVGSPDSIVPATRSASTAPRPADVPTDGLTHTFDYSGKVETVIVPADVYTAHVEVAGATGHNKGVTTHNEYFTGYGATVSGNLSVHPGDQLTVAVGGAGGAENGNHAPGGGGWSLNDHYRGGNGGSGHGSQTTDGAGGGGASVVQVNGATVVVAGGGGGQGGLATKADMSNTGGRAGAESGHDGANMLTTEDASGKGGSSAHPALDQNGHSYSGSLLKGGGGGGGGGRYTGGGGQPSINGGGGGGGGSSLYDTLSAVSTGNTTGGDGAVTITWVMLPADKTVTLAKTGTSIPVLLDVPNGRTDAGTKVDVAAPATNGSDNRQVADFQVWTYRANAQGSGQLVNKQTGKCLQVNGTNGAVDQWDCSNDQNHLWKLMPNPGGGTALQVYLDGHTPQPSGFYYLATDAPANQVAPGTGLTVSSQQGDATGWTLTTVGG